MSTPPDRSKLTEQISKQIVEKSRRRQADELYRRVKQMEKAFEPPKPSPSAAPKPVEQEALDSLEKISKDESLPKNVQRILIRSFKQAATALYNDPFEPSQAQSMPVSPLKIEPRNEEEQKPKPEPEKDKSPKKYKRSIEF